MSSLPYLRDIFDHLTRGCHLSAEDEPLYSALGAQYEAYAAYYGAMGFELVRHEREFFYFAPENAEKVPETLPRIAVFAYILVDHAANQGQPVEEYVLGRNFLFSTLPHFGLERYAMLLRQVDVHDEADLRRVIDHMERVGWAKWLGDDELRFLRPFHRVFDRCSELAREAAGSAGEGVAGKTPPSAGPMVSESGGGSVADGR